MTTIVLDTLDAARLVSANQRIHYRVRAEVCAYWRTLGRDAVIDAYGEPDPGETWHERVRVVLTFRFPTRRRRDVGNLYPFCAKPLVDGMVDGSLVTDDDDLHLVGPDLRRDLSRGPPRIVVDIEDLSDPCGTGAHAALVAQQARFGVST